jgi:hypothetical protein
LYKLAVQKFEKSLNTREKCFFASRGRASVRQDRQLPAGVARERLRRRSFWLLGVSQTCSHLIHMLCLSALAHGLRLEIARKTDKKKSGKKIFARKK